MYNIYYFFSQFLKNIYVLNWIGKRRSNRLFFFSADTRFSCTNLFCSNFSKNSIHFMGLAIEILLCNHDRQANEIPRRKN